MDKKLYSVLASETVFYDYEVEAESEEEAREMVLNGEVDHPPISDSRDFDVVDVDEIVINNK